MRFAPQFLDEIRARLPVSQVVGRKVALKKKGREYSGLSPFKSEKTPSFFVNDIKGFYHCFASGEHGDIFTFVMKTEGLSFPEAVERLAEEAGLQMPKAEVRENSEKRDLRERLQEALECAAKYFEEQLRSSAGSEARRYLEKRGLKRETISAFRLGYAPNSRTALKEALTRAGFTTAELATSGMLISGDDIPQPYDRFRHRVMFPITDLKGRVIAFGGRALDPDQPAKYLNSPETPLFHKGYQLFNAHRARPLAHDRGRIVVVEGYMDVIALCEAGIGEAVAPLGTALTADQVKLLWRMAPEPVLCFDGDSAGRKAAYRAIETVLPDLKPGYSVQFAFLPDGLDPDDLIRQSGAEGMQAELAKTRPLFDVLWEREELQHNLDTPEHRAAFEMRLRALAAQIGDPTVRTYYEQELRQRLWTRNRSAPLKGFRADQRGRGGRVNNAQQGVGGDWRAQIRARMGRQLRNGPQVPVAPSRELSSLVEVAPPREALLLKTLLNHPWLIDDHAEEIAAMTLTSQAAAKLRDALLSAQGLDKLLDRTTLSTQLSKMGLDRVVDFVERSITHKGDRFAEPDADRAEVETGWRHTLALHERQVGLQRSLAAAERAFHEDGNEEAQARIFEIQRLIAQLSRVDAFETGLEDGRTA
jgi:DNA primase